MVGYKVVRGKGKISRYSATDMGYITRYIIGKEIKKTHGPFSVFSNKKMAQEFASVDKRKVFLCEFTKSKEQKLWYKQKNGYVIINWGLPFGVLCYTILADSVKLIKEI